MPDAVGVTHHVKINGEHYMVRPFSYRKSSSPAMGPRFASGDPDYSQLNLWQYWAQSCWIGGAGSKTWTDDAMYDQGVGVDTSQHEVAFLARDLGPNTNRDTVGNWDLDGFAGKREFYAFRNFLYCLSWGSQDGVTPGKLYRWDNASSTWVLVWTFSSQYVRGMEYFGGSMVIGINAALMAKLSQAEVMSTFAKPAGIDSQTTALKEYRGKLYVAFGNQIWRLKPDFTWDGSTVFYSADGVDSITSMEVHLGFLYMSSNNGHILRTDGNNTFDLWAFDRPSIRSIRSFDGRLFVAVDDPSPESYATEAVLYQFSNSSVTELKRWVVQGGFLSTGNLRIVGKRLMFGAGWLFGDAAGFGIGAYDAAEDAYHILASNRDDTTYTAPSGYNWVVDDVIAYGGYIWISVRGYGIFRTKFTVLNAVDANSWDTTGNGDPSGENGGYLVSSEFDAGTPGLDKYWSSIQVHADLQVAASTVDVWYKLNDGAWINAGTVTKTGAETRYNPTFKLDVKGARLRWKLVLRTTDQTRTPRVYGVVVRYLPRPDPTRRWDMDLLVSDKQHLLDGTTQVLSDANKQAKINAIETAWALGEPINFVDLDGTSWAAAGADGVFLMEFTHQALVPTANPTGDNGEAIMRVVLLESVVN